MSWHKFNPLFYSPDIPQPVESTTNISETSCQLRSHSERHQNQHRRALSEKKTKRQKVIHPNPRADKSTSFPNINHNTKGPRLPSPPQSKSNQTAQTLPTQPPKPSRKFPKNPFSIRRRTQFPTIQRTTNSNTPFSPQGQSLYRISVVCGVGEWDGVFWP